MTRKKRDFTREILPDPKYGDLGVARAINVIMRQGKKGIAEKAIYGALDVVQQKLNMDPLEAFHKAVENIMPLVEVRSRRVGGATYQVPTEVPSKRGEALALRWMLSSANSRSEHGLSGKLAGEIMDAFNRRGAAVKKREDTHKMAEANKAFAHFRW
ncbi:MAG: 30S ribosomal protein S7 [Deltaproteobacteria bacterium]|nr:30S ribosomal protein S7 [Deltaproteobacteria bacterium]